MTVFVTGSSRGIGKAIAAAFAGEGHSVAINCAHSDVELASAEKEIMNINPKTLAVFADMSLYNEAEATIGLINEAFGDIDVLVNNAGVSSIALFQQTGPEDWKRVIDANIYSLLNCTRLSLPGMVKKKRGRVINISSVWGERGASCEAVYSMTKGAVNAFTKSLALELAPVNITVNAIACGVFDTDMNGGFTAGERAALIERIGAGRLGDPRDAAALALFLAGEGAAYLTGQIIAVDGGFV